jgi:hypothetical protein
VDSDSHLAGWSLSASAIIFITFFFFFDDLIATTLHHIGAILHPIY